MFDLFNDLMDDDTTPTERDRMARRMGYELGADTLRKVETTAAEIADHWLDDADPEDVEIGSPAHEAAMREAREQLLRGFAAKILPDRVVQLEQLRRTYQTITRS